MDVTYRIDKDILYIALEGRIDSSNAADAEAKIFEIKNKIFTNDQRRDSLWKTLYSV